MKTFYSYTFGSVENGMSYFEMDSPTLITSVTQVRMTGTSTAHMSVCHAMPAKQCSARPQGRSTSRWQQAMLLVTLLN